jgi:hypothetical protein
MAVSSFLHIVITNSSRSIALLLSDKEINIRLIVTLRCCRRDGSPAKISRPSASGRRRDVHKQQALTVHASIPWKQRAGKKTSPALLFLKDPVLCNCTILTAHSWDRDIISAHLTSALSQLTATAFYINTVYGPFYTGSTVTLSAAI